MYYMFSDCTSLISLNLSNLNTKNLKNMESMCRSCISLVSTPFPMIICINELLIYIFDINGNFIHVESMADGRKVQIHIDKNCGIVQDFISKNNKEYSLPFIDEINNNHII